MYSRSHLPTEASFGGGVTTTKTPGRPRVSPNQDSHPPGLNFPALLQKRRGTQNHGNAVRYPYVNAGQAMRPVRLASSQFYFDVHAGRKIQLHQRVDRSEEHTSELQSLMRNSYAVFCLKKKNTT